MNKKIIFLICMLTVISLSACVKKQGEVDDVWQRAVLEIYSVSENQTIGIVSNVTNVEQFFNMIDMGQWELIKSIPKDVENLYKFTIYYEVVDPAFVEENNSYVSSCQYLLYELDGIYYIEMFDNNLPVTYWMINSSVYEKILEFIEDNEIIENNTVENIVTDWGFSDFDKTKVLNIDESDYEKNEKDYGKNESDFGIDIIDILLQESSNVTYAGIAAVSKNQKIEKLSGNEENCLYEINDLHAIVDFINNEDIGEWKHILELPMNAEIKYIFIRYSAHKKTMDPTLYEMYRHALYKDGDKYYVDYIFPELHIDANENDTAEKHYYFEIPEKVGEYLCNLGSE